MRCWMMKAVMTVLALLLVACLRPVTPTAPGGDKTLTPMEEAPVAIEEVEELWIYTDGEKKVHKPRLGEAVEVVRSLLDILPKLNLQALCSFADEDVARMREEQDSVELVFAQPVDVVISQWIPQDGRSYIPTDERGYRVLRLKRALFLLEGELAGHILARDEEGEWSCWAVEGTRGIDTGWIALAMTQIEGKSQ